MNWKLIGWCLIVFWVVIDLVFLVGAISCILREKNNEVSDEANTD